MTPMDDTKTAERKHTKVSTFLGGDDLLRLKIAVAQSGQNQQDWLAEAIREKLDRETEARVIPMERQR